MFLLILENILKKRFKNASCIPLYAFIFAWSAHFRGAYFEILDLDSASPFPYFKSFSWQWTNRQNGCHWPSFSSLYQSKGNCEVKVIMLVWSWHQRLMPSKNYLLCVSFNIYKFLGFCLQCTYTQLLEESYLLFVSSSDLIYDITIKEKARLVPLWGYDFDHRILNCTLLYFRGSNENKSQENWEPQGGPFYSEVDYFIFNPLPSLCLMRYAHACIHVFTTTCTV